jgi:hypothetical protein
LSCSARLKNFRRGRSRSRRDGPQAAVFRKVAHVLRPRGACHESRGVLPWRSVGPSLWGTRRSAGRKQTVPGRSPPPAHGGTLPCPCRNLNQRGIWDIAGPVPSLQSPEPRPGSRRLIIRLGPARQPARREQGTLPTTCQYALHQPHHRPPHRNEKRLRLSSC